MGGVGGDTVSVSAVKCDTSPQVADGGIVFCVLPSHHSNSILMFYTNIARHFQAMKILFKTILAVIKLFEFNPVDYLP